ncbi:hypothetical protein FNYG_14077 [Fusarium nygamai]|uniref:Uncharacterized protein n=1 Tax=Gibberella nygamai TaxID=42673 RepID=A0A2K0UTQ3_GIBNY|nr:hypothetical protein FNYG_14077 [Fusarium nygamai]
MTSSQLSELEVETASLDWQSENEIMYLTESLSVSAEKAFKLVFKVDDQISED